MSAVLEAPEPSAQYLETVQPALVQQFGLLATAPGGVARLRELILTLAVQGMLVPQDPRDEPASVFVERIGSGQAGRSKVRAGDPTVDGLSAEEEAPFILPVGWKWARLGIIFTLQYGAALPEKSRVQGPIPVYGSNGQVGTHCEAFVYAPSLVIGRKGSVGAVNVTSGPFWPIDTSYFVTPPDGVHLQFAYWLFRSLRLGKHDKATAIPGISRNDVYAELIALPPTAEQARIVARVDELMQLCDALEAKGRLEAQQHARLLETLLGTLTDSTTPEELAANWQRVAEHFDLLMDRPEAVDVLEQTVLQLAVRGLLVPQDPSDESASELVRCIRSYRDEQVKSGLAKRERPFTPLSEADLPFELPTGWEWIRFDDLIEPAKPISYGVLVPGPDIDHGVPFVRIADLSLTDPPVKPEKSISTEVDAQYQRTRLEGGEILMGVVGSIGKLGVAPLSWTGANIARAICRIVPVGLVNKGFVLLLLQSEFMRSSFAGDTRTLAQPTLNVGLIRSSATPLPPIAEQTRIVVRVTELRRLCADLRQRLAAGQATQSRLAETLVESALA